VRRRGARAAAAAAAHERGRADRVARREVDEPSTVAPPLALAPPPRLGIDVVVVSGGAASAAPRRAAAVVVIYVVRVSVGVGTFRVVAVAIVLAATAHKLAAVFELA